MLEHPSDADLVSLLEQPQSPGAAAVRNHVSSCAECLSVMVELARVSGNETPTLPGGGAGGTPPSRTLDPGAKLGRYSILARLGAGAMGVVYSAQDPVLGRVVAIKVLRHDLSVSQKPRLLQEARTLAQLSHPNVSAIYDAGTDGGTTFLAMEYLEGTSLRVHLLARQLKWPQMLELFRQAAQGLAAAHAIGIVQRDFKPENVMVTRAGRAVVTDFGLADAEASIAGLDDMVLESDSMLATRRDFLVGTPAYMAPEQLRGEAADAKSDQFSFCATLYEAMFGTRPFQGTTFRALREAVMSNTRTMPSEPLEAPSEKARAALMALLDRGLSLTPSSRFKNMNELMVALDKIIQPPAHTSRWLGLGAVAASVLVALGSWVAYRRTLCTGAASHLEGTWGAPQKLAIQKAFEKSTLSFAPTVSEHVVAALDGWASAWVAERTEACEATELRHEQPPAVYSSRLECLEMRRLEVKELVVLLGQADDVLVSQALTSSQALSNLSVCAESTHLLSPIAPPATAEQRERVSELREGIARSIALFAAGKYAEARGVAAGLTASVDAVGYGPMSASHRKAVGVVERVLGDGEAARVAFSACAAFATECKDDVQAASCYAELVFIEGGRLNNHEAAALAESAARSFIRRVGNPIWLRAKLANTRAQWLLSKGSGAAGVEAAREELALMQQLPGAQDDARTADALEDVGKALILMHDYAAAEPYFNDALTMYERINGVSHPTVAAVLSNRVAIEFAGQHLEQARASLERAFAIQRAALGEMNPVTQRTRMSLAYVDVVSGRLTEAEASLREILKQLDATEKPEVMLHADVLANLGSIVRSAHRPGEAVAYLERAMPLMAQTGVARLANAQFELAQAIADAGLDPRRSRSLAESAKKNWESEGSTFGGEVKEVEAWLARTKNR